MRDTTAELGALQDVDRRRPGNRDIAVVDTACARIRPDGDPYGERRIDAIRVNAESLGDESTESALVAYWVVDTELELSASDHLPVVCQYNPLAITKKAPRHV